MSETLDQLSKELLRFQEERRIAAMVRERYSNARRFPRKKKASGLVIFGAVSKGARPFLLGRA